MPTKRRESLRVHETEVSAVFREYWREGYGSIAADEVMFVQDLIGQHRPRTFIEVGMASGISTGIIARIMDQNSGEKLVSIDHDNTFFADPSQENGFLIDKIYEGHRVQVEKRPFTYAFDVPSLEDRFEMGFIDANHQHPWPTLDTLCLYPRMTGPRVLIHQDLALFRQPQPPIGIGPKYLFDQIPSTHRSVGRTRRQNIFVLDLTLSKDCLSAALSDSLRLPWTLRSPLGPSMVSAIQDILLTRWGDNVLEAFNSALSTFSPPR